MKRILTAFFAIFLFACNNAEKKEAPETKAAVPANLHGFKPTYSTSFEMDPATNTETVLALWKQWEDGDLSKSRAHFADSLGLFLADGSSMAGPTDTILKNMQGFRSSFKSIDVEVDAAFATKSTDKNENWVTIWGTEVMTDMNGKADSVSVHEIWRFNKTGKVDMMFQYTRKGIVTPPPPAAN